jgi:rhamnulokinase
LILAERLLTVPDLLYYWLTGVAVNEFTNATTTQAFNTGTRDWAFELLDWLHIPTRLFQPVSEPGQILGKTDSNIPVVLVPHHDTACAVIGVPAADAHFAYLSSGTWSLLGLEIDQPIINTQALALNVTNEGGYGGTTRLLKNIMGLWLLQESRRTWIAAGDTYGYDQLAAMAQQSPAFVSLIDPDAPDFLAPGDMPARIRDFCARTGQTIPETVGAIARCIFESLALKYRIVLEQLKTLTGRQVDVLHVVGGGSQNALLCQMTADATGIPVIAGPTEATALGNSIVQLIALGELASVAEGRALIRNSFDLATYQPQNNAQWESVVTRFKSLLSQ